MFHKIATLPTSRGAWLALAATSIAFLGVALYFQYQMSLEPCVKCIYQRTAMLAIGLSALIPWLNPRFALLRLIGYAGWLTAAIWGAKIATEHVDFQGAANSFFVVCDTFPNFPSFMPLHEWLPSFFGAPGLCGDIQWQFAGLSMPAWMQIIFASYAAVGIAVLLIRLAVLRRL